MEGGWVLDWLALVHDCHRQLVYGVSIEVHMINIEVLLAQKVILNMEANSDITDVSYLDGPSRWGRPSARPGLNTFCELLEYS